MIEVYVKIICAVGNGCVPFCVKSKTNKTALRDVLDSARDSGWSRKKNYNTGKMMDVCPTCKPRDV